jgi:hypothetical protein
LVPVTTAVDFAGCWNDGTLEAIVLLAPTVFAVTFLAEVCAAFAGDFGLGAAAVAGVFVGWDAGGIAGFKA